MVSYAHKRQNASEIYCLILIHMKLLSTDEAFEFDRRLTVNVSIEIKMSSR